MGLTHLVMDGARAAEAVQRIHQASARQGVQNGAERGQDAPETLPPLPPGITGAMILNDARDFAATVLHATGEQLDALVLACAVTHVIDSFTTVPRILATAPAKESGKSTLLNVVAMLGNNPEDADPTSFALRAMFNEREKPLVIIDEISEFYGPMGLRQGPPDLNKVLTKGYAKNAQLSLSVDRAAVKVSCYCVAALGGLRKAVRDDIWSRCIEWKLRPVPAGVRVRDALDEDTQAVGRPHGARLHQWARLNEADIHRAFRSMRRPHRKFYSRLRQIWGPLYSIALVAGEDWPDRCLAAFKAMALDASEMPVLTAAQTILRDTARHFARTGTDRMFCRDIRDHLRAIPDVELYEALSDRGFGQLMTEALGPAASMDIGEERARGYQARPVLAAWKRLEALLEPEDDEPEDDDEYDLMFEVEQITQVMHDTQEMAGAS